MTRLREQGKTVFVNSHLLSELEAISNRVAILVAGRVARQGTIDELTISQQRYEIEVVWTTGQERDKILAALPGVFVQSLRPSVPPPAAVPPALPLPSPPGRMPLNFPAPPLPPPRMVDRGKLPAGFWAELEGPVLRLGTTDPVQVQGVLDQLRSADLVIRRMQAVRPSLEDLFMEAVTKPAPGGAT
jgi:ABC-2 type transport system ATP-binding protein